LIFWRSSEFLNNSFTAYTHKKTNILNSLWKTCWKLRKSCEFIEIWRIHRI